MYYNNIFILRHKIFLRVLTNYVLMDDKVIIYFKEDELLSAQYIFCGTILPLYEIFE